MISNNKYSLVNKDKIMNISTMAKVDAKTNPDVINGTIGMLFDDNGKLAHFDAVDKSILTSINQETFSYGGVTGGNVFKEAIFNWLFSKTGFKENEIGVISTVGATGALSISMRNYVDKGQTVLLPNIRWSSYDNIAGQIGIKVSEYNLFKDKKLDIDSIKESVNKSLHDFKRCYIIINDPCHNPTGYSLSLKEWEEILKFLNQKSKEGKIILLDDIAYMNYSKKPYDDVFILMKKYINDNFMIHVAFSAAKTLSIYGLRGGALIALTNKNEYIDEFNECTYATARSTWSMPNNLANIIIQKCFNDPKTNLEIKKQLNFYSDMLIKRGEIFLKILDKMSISYRPYKNGFFILVDCNNGDNISNLLIKKHIYVVPMATGVRVSLASVPLDKIERLAYELSYAIKGELNEKYN